MTRQVYLFAHGAWSDIIAECETFIVAKDIDGLMTYVVKNGMEQVRMMRSE